MRKKQKSPVLMFAELEAEIAKYGVPPPKPHPWAINADGTTDMALRNLQMLEFLEDLRKQAAKDYARARHEESLNLPHQSEE